MLKYKTEPFIQRVVFDDNMSTKDKLQLINQFNEQDCLVSADLDHALSCGGRGVYKYAYVEDSEYVDAAFEWFRDNMFGKHPLQEIYVRQLSTDEVDSIMK